MLSIVIITVYVNVQLMALPYLKTEIMMMLLLIRLGKIMPKMMRIDNDCNHIDMMMMMMMMLIDCIDLGSLTFVYARTQQNEYFFLNI